MGILSNSVSTGCILLVVDMDLDLDLYMTLSGCS